MTQVAPTTRECDTIDLATYTSYFDQRLFTAEAAHGRIEADIRAVALGKPLNWRIGDTNRNDAFGHVTDIARQHNVYQVIAPDISAMNAHCCELIECTEQHTSRDVNVHFGVEADGVLLPQHTCFFMASADCPTLVFKDAYAGRVAVAHAGRESLVDRTRVLTGHASRHHESVVYEVLQHLCDALTRPEHIYVRICYGINKNFPHPPDHRVYGPYNRTLVRELQEMDARAGTQAVLDEASGDIALHELVKAQAFFAGIPHDNIRSDSVDTGVLVEDFWSNSRGDHERNGIFIIRE